jgi:hypothetical protein
VEGKNAWVIEAKAPAEEIVKSVHVEQAYSYAIHHEIRVNYFTLCNGKYFALYDIKEIQPLLYFATQILYQYWNDLKSRLEPQRVFITDHSFKKDLGLHMKRLGFNQFDSIIFPHVMPLFVAKINDDLFTVAASAKLENDTYVASFDFNLEVAKQLKGIIPEKGFQILMEPIKNEIRQLQFDKAIYLNIDAFVGEKLEENDKEIFLPLVIKKFLP